MILPSTRDSRCYREAVVDDAAGAGGDKDPAPSGLRSRALDVAAVLATLGLVIALAQLSAWRAAFSTVAAIAFAAAIFAFRYLRPRWRTPAAVACVVLSMTALVTVYLQPEDKPPAKPAAVLSPPSSAPAPLLLQEDALQPGDCIAANVEKLTSPVSVISCDGPHDGEVFLAADLWPAGAAFPGDDAVTAKTQAACRAAFKDYVGTEYLRSVFYDFFYYPDADLWKGGDRHAFCVAYDPDHKLNGTVRHAGR
jgi:hypothetical protein